jgi:8-oxo-dGTP pyrophosphatase MutT (NUDIX family)
MPIDRPTSRVVVLDPRDRILLFFGDLKVWFTPGGAVEPGEDHAAAAMRELREETSLHAANLGPCVWVRRHVWTATDGRAFRSIEHFFVLRAPTFTPRCESPDDVEEASVHRWWTATEIAYAIDETFAPRRLARLLPPIIAGDVPAEPVKIED